MKKIITLMVALTITLRLSAQNDYQLSSNFQRDFASLTWIKEQHPDSWSGCDLKVLEIELQALKTAIICTQKISNEWDYISLRNEFLCIHTVGWKRMYDSDSTSEIIIESKLTSEVVQKIEFLTELKNQFEIIMQNNNYHKEASIFFNSQIEGFYLEYDTLLQTEFSVIKFKKDLSKYTPRELYWMHSFGSYLFDKVSNDAEDALIASKKLQDSGFEPFVLIAGDFINE